MNKFKKVLVKNVPDVFHYDFMIIKAVEGEAWYYGGTNDINQAAEVAKHIGGLVVANI